jgi:hypothetical protein
VVELAREVLDGLAGESPTTGDAAPVAVLPLAPRAVACGCTVVTVVTDGRS